MHTWLLDVGQNMGFWGSLGSWGAAAAAAAESGIKRTSALAGYPDPFNYPPGSPFPPPDPYAPPPGFKSWPVEQQQKWVRDMVQDRRENPIPQSLDQMILQPILQWIDQGPDSTTAANGCTKG